jgi:hypothetical protein
MGYFDKNAHVNRFRNKSSAQVNLQEFKNVCHGLLASENLKYIALFAVKAELENPKQETIRLAALFDYDDSIGGHCYLIVDGQFLDDKNQLEIADLVNFADELRKKSVPSTIPKVIYCKDFAPQTEKMQDESGAAELLCDVVKLSVGSNMTSENFLKLFPPA